ncbi:MAG: CHAT domain-containing protein [Bacteroidetes bacterium]|nr:CHAT domain-containing protein [Bacteroidota bacterium]
MLRVLVSILLSAHSLSCFTQSTEAYLEKGRELLYAEEFRLSHYNLTQAIAKARKNSTKEAAQFYLVQSLLLTQEIDSATRLLEQLKGKLSFDKYSFLLALQKYQKGETGALSDFKAIAGGSSKDLLLLAKANFYLGILQYRLRSTSSIEESIVALTKSIDYFKKDSALTHIKIGLGRTQLADAFRVGGKLELALLQSDQALRIFQTSPYATPIHFANAYAAAGRIHFDSQRYFTAAGLFEKSLKLRLSTQLDSAAIGVTFSNLAVTYELLNDQNNCERAYEQAAKYWHALRNQPNRTIPFANNRALFLHGIHESAEAIQILERILPEAKLGNIQSQFTTRYNLTTLYYNLGEFEKARKLHNDLVAWQSQRTNQFSIADDLRIKILHAMILSKENKLSEAIQECRAIETILSTTRVSAKETASFYDAFADILMSADRFQTSKQYLNEARLHYDQTHNTAALITNGNSLAMTCFQLEQYDSALLYASHSLEQNTISSKQLIYPYRLPMHAIQGCFIIIFSRIKQFEKTRDQNFLSLLYPYEQLGIDLIRAIRKNLYSDADRLYYNKKVAEFYKVVQLAQFYRMGLRADANEKFFEYAEESKFQALVNSMSAARVTSFKEVNTLLVSEEQQLAKRKVLENNQLIQLLSQSDDAEEVEQRREASLTSLSTLQRKHQLFLDSLHQHFTGYYELKYGGEPLNLTVFQKQLTPRQLVLQWKVLDSIILLQSIHHNHVSTYKIEQADNISKQIKKLRNQIKFKLDGDLISTAQLLYKELLSKALDEIEKRKETITELIIVPDGFLFSLPFEVLMKDRSRAIYLVESHNVHYAYSCQLMMKAKVQTRAETSLAFLGVAPTFGSVDATSGSRSSGSFAGNVAYNDFDFQPLQENEGEVMSIVSLAQQKNATLLTGEQATEGRIKKIDLVRYRYIHFATHGFVDHGGQGNSGLALTNADASEDNLLLSSEIYGLSMQAELVCLSACETGLGDNVPGEGLMGLGRAFFYAGARNLLVSLWKVPDKSTSLFMIDFYNELFIKRLSLSTSLRQAKLKMIKTKEYNSPYYWAPFVLTGAN